MSPYEFLHPGAVDSSDEEALQSAQLLGHGLLDEILDSGALCLEPGELMPIVLTLGGAELKDGRMGLYNSFIGRTNLRPP